MTCNTLFIVRNIKHDVSETGSVSVLMRGEGDTYSGGSHRANLIHWSS
jgi:hypothetical protein